MDKDDEGGLDSIDDEVEVEVKIWIDMREKNMKK
jgi:hypothetical protein